MVEAAQERRNRRAEQARHKYRRMSEDERRAVSYSFISHCLLIFRCRRIAKNRLWVMKYVLQYNAMRDAQRRSRRRDLEGLSDGEDGERGTEEIRRFVRNQFN